MLERKFIDSSMVYGIVFDMGSASFSLRWSVLRFCSAPLFLLLCVSLLVCAMIFSSDLAWYCFCCLLVLLLPATATYVCPAAAASLRYGLGDRRTLDQFIAFSGIDTIHQKITDNRCGNIG